MSSGGDYVQKFQTNRFIISKVPWAIKNVENDKEMQLYVAKG